MPTSNHTNTDTNNNSKNKITNGIALAAAPLPATAPGGEPLQQQQQQQQQQVAENNLQLKDNHLDPPDNFDEQQPSKQATFIPSAATSKHKPNHNTQHNNKSTQQQQHPSCRPIEVLTKLLKDINFDRTTLTNEELIKLVKHQQISVYKLESLLGKESASRCVAVRRDYYKLELAELDKIDPLGIRDRAKAFNQSSYRDELEYEKVNGACCENVIGHVKIPVGLAGPLVLDGEEIFVPLATTEGCLVASTCRGLSALRKSGGVSSRVRKDFMTRAPIVRFQDPNLTEALDNVERAIAWLNDKHNKEKIRAAFNLTSSHGRFSNYTLYPVAREIHIRFEAQTGDAMGMNMCSKGVESALKEMQRSFPTMEIVTLSGNMCTDKKAAGVNWINGRGKSVECTAELPAHVVRQVFKVSVDSMIDRWKSKVMVGSALAASMGGFNSQAANILTAIFIATGQDPAQNVTSSNCMLILEKDTKGSLVVCCTMPSIECGTVGGGTILGDQSRYLQLMGVKGPTPNLSGLIHSLSSNSVQTIKSNNNNNNKIGQLRQVRSVNGDISMGPPSADQQRDDLFNSSSSSNNNNFMKNDDSRKSISTSASHQASSNSSTRPPPPHLTPLNSSNGYTNARKLARIVCATVMAGELSLLAALTEGTLVKSHMRHNRSSNNVPVSGLIGSLGASSGSDLSSCFENGPMHLVNNFNVRYCSGYSSSSSSTSSTRSAASAGSGGGGSVGAAAGGGGGERRMC